MWLPILDITGELLNLAAEIEALDITARARGARPRHSTAPTSTPVLSSHQEIFWSSRPARTRSGRHGDHVRRAGRARRPRLEAPDGCARRRRTAPVETVPEPTVARDPRPARDPDRGGPGSWIRSAGRSTAPTSGPGSSAPCWCSRLLGALASVAPSVVGASVPQRYVTITLDGQTVGSHGPPGDGRRGPRPRGHRASDPTTGSCPPRAPSSAKACTSACCARSRSTSMSTARARRCARPRVRPRRCARELGIDDGLVADGSTRLAAGVRRSRSALRTTSRVQVDGRTIEAPRSKALDVAGLLTEQGIPLGPRDEVQPAADTRLVDGLQVQVFRLADNQVAERVAVPFTTETCATTRTCPSVRPARSRPASTVCGATSSRSRRATTGRSWRRSRSAPSCSTPPVAQVVVKGTAAASGRRRRIGHLVRHRARPGNVRAPVAEVRDRRDDHEPGHGRHRDLPGAGPWPRELDRSHHRPLA